MDKLVDALMDRLIEDGETPLRLWREQREMSLSALADAVGIKASKLEEYEAGMWKPDEELTQKLALALGVEPGDLDNPQDDSWDIGLGDGIHDWEA